MQLVLVYWRCSSVASFKWVIGEILIWVNRTAYLFILDKLFILMFQEGLYWKLYSSKINFYAGLPLLDLLLADVYQLSSWRSRCAELPTPLSREHRWGPTYQQWRNGEWSSDDNSREKLLKSWVKSLSQLRCQTLNILNSSLPQKYIYMFNFLKFY